MLEQLEHIGQRELSRKEFLKIIGLSALSLLGFSNIIRLLSGSEHRDLGSSYNSGDYGG